MVEEVRYAGAKDYKQVCLAWGGTMLLLCLAGALHCRGVAVPSAQHALGKGKPASVGKLILIKTKMLLKVQLPPGRLWASIRGGLSLVDFLLVCTWLALVLWYFLDELQGKLAQLDERIQGNPSISSDFVSIKRQKAAAKSLGTCMRVQLLLLLYPVQRSSLLAWLFGTHFSSVIKYHRWLGWGLVSTIFMHGYLYSVVWLSQGSWMAKVLHDASNAAGVVAACVACTIASTSAGCFRRWWYQAFWLMHICSMPLFFVAIIIHDPGIAYHSLPGVLLYCLDRAFRTWQHHTNTTYVSVAGESLVVRGNIITMYTPWSAEGPHGLCAGQTLYLSCPAISLFGSHPFSIADVRPLPSSNGLQVLIATVHMRVAGSWTRKLKQLALQHPNRPLRMQVEGPYNTEVSDALLSWGPHSHTNPHGFANMIENDASQLLQPLPGAPQVLTMVSGGIGVTPLLGVLRLLARQHDNTLASSHRPASQPRREADIELGQAPSSMPEWDRKGNPLLLRTSEINGYTQLSCCEELQDQAVMDGCTGIDGPSKDLPNSATVHVSEATGHTAPSKLPHVYLVYCCRHLEELQLLDTQLLEAASRGPSWLHLHIAYTGFELEHQPKGLLADEGFVAAEPSKPPQSFPSGQTPTLLYPSLGLHPLIHVAHAALTFLGAAGAGLLLPAIICAALASTNQEQPGELMWGLMVSALMGLGAFLTPFLLLVCSEGKRRRQSTPRSRSARCCTCCLDCCGRVGDSCAWWWGWLFGRHKPQDMSSNSTRLGTSGAVHADNGLTPLIQTDLQQACVKRQSAREACTPSTASLRVLPGYVLAWGDHPSNRIPLHRGRSPLASLLRCILGRHSSTHSTAASTLPMLPTTASKADNADCVQDQHRSTCSTPAPTAPSEADIHGSGALREHGAPARGTNGSTQSSRAWGDSRMWGDSTTWVEELPQLGREGLPVWVGGPEALWQGVCAVCEELNMCERSKCPRLDALRVAHLH